MLVCLQQRPVYLLQILGWIDAEFGGQDLARAVIFPDRLGRPPGAGQRAQELAPQRFPQGVTADIAAQLRDHPVVPAGGQVKLRALLHGGQALVGQRGYHVPVQGSRPRVRQRITAPQPQRLVQEIQLGRVVVRLSSGSDQAAEPQQIHLVGRDVKHVAVACRDDLGGHHDAQSRRQGLQAGADT